MLPVSDVLVVVVVLEVCGAYGVFVRRPVVAFLTRRRVEILPEPQNS